MNNIDMILILLTLIEFANLTIRVMKLLPQRVPDIDKNILRTMYS